MVTKRQLGIVFIAVGVIVAVATFAADWAGASAFSGIGPLQRLLLGAAGVLVVLGLPLLRLGRRPA